MLKSERDFDPHAQLSEITLSHPINSSRARGSADGSKRYNGLNYNVHLTSGFLNRYFFFLLIRSLPLGSTGERCVGLQLI